MEQDRLLKRRGDWLAEMRKWLGCGGLMGASLGAGTVMEMELWDDRL